MAEEIFMVEIHARNYGNLRHEDVGGVEASAEPGFDHCKLHPGFCKVHKRDCRHALKECGMSAQLAPGQLLLDDAVNAREHLRKRLIGNFSAIDANPFV